VKVFLDASNIVEERSIICACWKWEGEKAIHAATWDKKHNPTPVLHGIVEALTDADECVAHNGDRFDLPWIRAMCLKHGVQCPPSFKTTDTLKLARKYFNLNSNRLDYLAKFLGVGGKIKTDFDLWRAIALRDDAKAMAKMVRYCKNDVAILEKVHHALIPYTPAVHNHAVLNHGEKSDCPECGDAWPRMHDRRVTVRGTVSYVMRCTKCGKSFMICERVFKELQERKNKRFCNSMEGRKS
jgi:DNA polymerase elongation subunit (family B)